MKTVEHILVPTDFSDPSDRALTLAIDLARAFGARLTLLHIWTMPNTGYTVHEAQDSKKKNAKHDEGGHASQGTEATP